MQFKYYNIKRKTKTIEFEALALLRKTSSKRLANAQ